MALTDLISDKTTVERSTLKAETYRVIVASAIAASVERAQKFTLRDGRTVCVEQAKRGILDATKGTVTLRKDGGSDPVWFRISVDGKYLNGDGWYGIVNPPILVPDGTYEDGLDTHGQPVRIPNFREDPEAAFRIWLGETFGSETL